MTVLAADMGGRRIKLGLVRDGAVIAMQVLPADSDRPLQERLSHVAKTLREMCAQQGISPANCAGIGLSYPSIVDSTNGRILDHFGKYGEARELDLPAWARREFGLPLAIDNDARVAAIGEWQYGAGRGCANLVMITLGTGIGTGVIINGQVLRGPHGQAGILGGHLTVQAGGRPCVCGNVGCAEAEASTWALRKILAENEAVEPGPAEIDYARVFQRASEGQEWAVKIRDHSLHIWAATAVSLIHAYDPERIIWGGGIMGSAAAILPQITAYVARHAHTPWGQVALVPSQLRDQAALAGCEWLVKSKNAYREKT